MNTPFKNSIISPENLPIIEKVDFNPIDRKYLKLIYIRLLIFAVIITSMFVLIITTTQDEYPSFINWLVSGLLLALFCYAFIIARLSFPYRAYLIREKDIAYKRGLIRFTLTSIPFKRIQHVELTQGVLAKQMKLASIKVYTAGGSSEDLTIPGLNEDNAKQIREFLTDKISADD